jgi:four helix bundle protein
MNYSLDPRSADPRSQHCAPSAQSKYVLRDKSFNFGLLIVKFLLSLNYRTFPLELRGQLIRSGTSIGANVEEADDSSSRRDFAHKIRIARSEAKETKYWLRIICEGKLLNNESHIKTLEYLLAEVDQLIRITSAILKQF